MLFLPLLVLLIFINGYFSAAEIALVSVKRFKIQQEADKGNKTASRILQFMKDPDEYLSAIQVGITLVGMIEGLYGGQALESYIHPILTSWGISQSWAHLISLVTGIGAITYITIVLGELLPKSIAIQNPQKIALLLTPSFRIFTLLAYPFIQLLTWSTHFLFRILRIRNAENQKLSEADLKSLLSLAYRQGTLEKNEWQLHENVFNFYESNIDKIMTPRDKVVTIDNAMTAAQIADVLRNSPHNYFPVQQHNKVIGYLCSRDFFKDNHKPLEELTLPACTLMPGQNAAELLEKFKEKNKNFGIILTANNELAGVITMHDILEVLVGKIP